MSRHLIRFIGILFCFWSSTAYAQSSRMSVADSLAQQLHNTPDDTKKVNLYLQLLFTHTYDRPEDGEKYIQPAITLSRRLDFRLTDVLLSAGRIYWKQGKMDQALQYHFEALKLTDPVKQPDFYGAALTAIGQDYADAGNYPEAMKYFLKAKEMHLKTGNQKLVARCYVLISWVYQKKGDFIGSSKTNLDALRLCESMGDHYGYAITSSNLANDFIQLGKYEEARSYVLKAFVIQKQFNDKVNLSDGYLILAEVYLRLNEPSKSLANADSAFMIGASVNDRYLMGNALSKKADIYFKQGDYRQAASLIEEALHHYHAVTSSHLLAEKYSKLSICYSRIGEKERAKSSIDSAAFYLKNIESPAVMADYFNGRQLYDSLSNNWKEAYSSFSSYIQIRDSIYNAENTKKLLQNQVQYEFDKKEAAARAEQEKKDIRQRNIRNSIAGALGGALIFLVVVYRQRNKIAKARKRSDELLLNILPEETAEELKQKGSAEARQFDIVTVMFTDFKNFTQASEQMTAKELVQEIHYCYSEFDKIVTKHRLEKIKTIGDSYMCAGGLPVENNTNARDTVAAALEISEFMQLEKQKREAEGKPFFEIRIGCHTGPVVAGIVGIKKFAYDIWGDTVNIASRMESSGETGKVNISGATYELVKDDFICKHRGKVSAKNKGEIDMYFAERKSYNQM